MNKVMLAGRLTRDPEMRALASRKNVTQFSLATTEFAGNGKERPESTTWWSGFRVQLVVFRRDCQADRSVDSGC